jgi:hypothetical protein
VGQAGFHPFHVRFPVDLDVVLARPLPKRQLGVKIGLDGGDQIDLRWLL